jgi:hypothetical protein
MTGQNHGRTAADLADDELLAIFPGSTVDRRRARRIGFGRCDRCKRRTDRAFIPDTDWLVCLECYLAWRAWKGFA